MVARWQAGPQPGLAFSMLHQGVGAALRDPAGQRLFVGPRLVPQLDSDVGGVGAKVETPKKDQAMFKQKFQDQLVELFVYVTPLFSDSVWCDAALEPSDEVVDRLGRFGDDVFYMLQRYICGMISGWEEIMKCGLIHL